MTALDVLSTIRQAGGTFGIENGDLRIVVPRGLLTAEQKAVLAGSKADLVRLLAPDADPERAAIQWLESLTPREAAVVVETASGEWAALVDADHNLDAWAEQQLSTPCEHANIANIEPLAGPVAEQCSQSSQCSQAQSENEASIDADANAILEQAVEPPSPCHRCGSLEVW